MEKERQLKKKRLIHELTQGMDLASQLRNHLDDPASRQTCEFLLGKILSTYDKALQMLQLSALLPVVDMLDSSSHSIAGTSPRSDRDSDEQCNKHGRKKRKTLPSWSEQVYVKSGNELEGPPLDDGHNWRKYGQKDILGAKFPRAYYRCTYRNSQGCLAIKQVQKSDEDPSIVQITYRGRHTCVQASQTVPVERGIPIENKDDPYLFTKQDEIAKKAEEEFPHVEADLKFENEELEDAQKIIFPFFSFPLESEENHLLGSFSSPFISPTTSESSYFSLPSCQLNNFEMNHHHMQSSESNLTEIVSDPTSVTNSPVGDWNFSLDQVDFDPDFAFDTTELFS